jgi:hypothetical protein
VTDITTTLARSPRSKSAGQTRSELGHRPAHHRRVEVTAGRVRLAVIEGDQETERDTERIRATGVPAVQINTGTPDLQAHAGHARRPRLLLDGGDDAVHEGELVHRPEPGSSRCAVNPRLCLTRLVPTVPLSVRLRLQ